MVTKKPNIDDVILSHIGAQWRKAAMVVAQVMTSEHFDDVDESVIAERIRHLAKDGRLESQGDLRKIRSSEIRLPHRDPHARDA